MADDALEKQLAELRQKLAELEALRSSREGQAPGEPKQETARLVQTGGGAVVEGDVKTDGGDAVLRDQNTLTVEGGISGGTQVVGTVIQYYPTYQQVEGRPALSEEDFQQFLTNYLTWVANYYDRARLFGLERVGVNEHQPSRSLRDVFIPLSLCRITPPRRDEVEERLGGEPDLEGLERIKAYLSLVGERQKEASEVDLADLLVTGRRLAVIGGPGCGKSTLLNYLAVCLARHINQGQELPFKLPGDRPAPVPLIVPLRGYREYQQLCRQSPQRRLEDPHAGTLAGYILYTLNHYGSRVNSFSADGFERLMLGGCCLVMLDGLDEVVDRRERGRVREEVEGLADGYPGNLFLVTAREAGYQEQAIFSTRFTRLDVRQLDEGQIRRLVENWCGQLYPGEEAARADEIVAAIGEINARRSDSELPPLVTTPLMTTMVVGVKWSRTQLPRERAKLYDAAVEVILRLQYTLDDPAREQLIEWGGTIDEQREWLWTLAYEMQRGGRAAAAVSRERIRSLLQPRLGQEAFARFIEAVHERGGLLEERAGLYQFAHLTLQEFMAARCIVDRRLEQAELAGYVSDAWWREVLLLAYGYAIYAAPAYARSLLGWLSEMPGEARLAGLELAGAAVLEIEKPNPELRRQQAEKLVVELTDPAKSYPAALRGRAGRLLNDLRDSRAGVLTLEAMPFCCVPEGPFRMGSRKGEEKAYDDENPQHEVDLPGFWLGQYPVTNAQYSLFVEAGGYKEERYWGEAAQAGYWKKGLFLDRSRPKEYRDPFGLGNHPVVGVSWYEALAFTRWLDELARARYWLGKDWQVKLPSEVEWEKAARGGLRLLAGQVVRPLAGLAGELVQASVENPAKEREYPWAGQFDAQRVNTDQNVGSTSAVGCFPGGASVYGCQDLSGNVWEWTRSLWLNYPYDPLDRAREDLQAGSDRPRVLRGGSFNDGSCYARCAYRLRYAPIHWNYYDRGFRVGVVAPIHR